MDCIKDKNGRKEEWKKNNVNSSFQQIPDESTPSNIGWMVFTYNISFTTIIPNSDSLGLKYILHILFIHSYFPNRRTHNVYLFSKWKNIN